MREEEFGLEVPARVGFIQDQVETVETTLRRQTDLISSLFEKLERLKSNISQVKTDNQSIKRAISVQSSMERTEYRENSPSRSGSKKSPGQKWLKSRSRNYSNSNVRRFICPPTRYDWSVAFKDYRPRNYTAEYLLKAAWADPNLDLSEIPFNNFDRKGGINRMSHSGDYKIDSGVPRFPLGRTGISGRGDLGLWGPNHAVDPIVTRWKKGKSDEKILEWIAIQRENGEWAIPGGMVRPNESEPEGNYFEILVTRFLFYQQFFRLKCFLGNEVRIKNNCLARIVEEKIFKLDENKEAYHKILKEFFVYKSKDIVYKVKLA